MEQVTQGTGTASADATSNGKPTGEEGKERKKNRRGKGSKARQAEKFRIKKEKLKSELQTENFNVSLTMRHTLRELFGEQQRIMNLYRKPIEFLFRTDLFGDLCDKVTSVLHGACKIPLPKEGDFEMDAETLKYVSALQVECKVYYARCGTAFVPDMDPEVAARVERTATSLDQALIPLAIYINQIGRFTVNDQMFVPRYNGSDDFCCGRLFDAKNHARASIASLVSVQPPGMITRFTDHQGDHMYAHLEEGTAEIVERNVAVNVGGQAQFACTGSVPTFEQIVDRYTDLKARVSKLANAFDQLDLTSGLGNASQIVFRSEIQNTATMEVWSPRSLHQDSLQLGAILALGDPNQSFADKQAAAIMCVIDTSGAIETLAGVLTKQMHLE